MTIGCSRPDSSRYHRVERDGVLRPEFEDVADLNGFLDDERLAALDARLTGR